MTKWMYKHPTNGTCVPDCKAWGICHCGCGGKTNRADRKNRNGTVVPGRHWSFINHHFRPSQWRERLMAICHPDQPNHGRGLCRRCYWKSYKRAYRNREAIDNWERNRYARFLELVDRGMKISDAIWQLERDVPSTVEATG